MRIGVDITSISCFYEFIQQADILDYTACLDEKGLVYQIVDFVDPRENRVVNKTQCEPMPQAE